MIFPSFVLLPIWIAIAIPIADQVVDVSRPYDFTLDQNALNVSFSLPILVTVQGIDPDWLSLPNYRLSNAYPFLGALSLVVKNDLAYVGGPENIAVVNISSQSPELVGTVPNTGVKLWLLNNTLYVADDSNMRLYDISNPTQPVAMEDFVFPFLNSIFCNIGNIVITSNSSDQGSFLYFFDTTTISHPQLRDIYYISADFIFTCQAQKDTNNPDINIFTFASKNRLYSLPLSITSPSITNFNLPSYLWNAKNPLTTVNENFFYIVDGEKIATDSPIFLSIYDINDNFTLISFSQIGQGMTFAFLGIYDYIFISIAGNETKIFNKLGLYLGYFNTSCAGLISFDSQYVMCFTSNLIQIVDIENPSFPVLGSNITTTKNLLGIAVIKDAIYMVYLPDLVTNATNYLEIWDLDDISNPVLITQHYLLFRPGSLMPVGDTIYVFGWSGVSIEILNVTSPRNPLLCANISIFQTSSYRLVGSIAYLFPSGLILNVSIPCSPTLIGMLPLRANTPILMGYKAAVGNNLYLWNTQKMIRITTSSNLILSHTDISVTITYFFLGKNGIGYVLSPSGIHFFDFQKNPLNPQLLSSYLSSTSYNLLHLKGHLLFGVSGQTLDYIDVSNISNPSIMGSYESASAITAIHSSTFLCVANSIGVSTFSLSSRPRLLAMPSMLQLGNRYLITADGLDGDGNVIISASFHVTVAMFPTLFQPIPNPNPWWSGKSFVFPISSTTFSSSENLTYTVSLTNGSSLPSWLTFNPDPTNLQLSGNASEVTQMSSWSIQVIATTPLGASRGATFIVAVQPHAAPILTNQLSTQQATVGEAFKFVVPENTFTNPEGEPLAYAAILANGSPLPAWLSFNHLTFSGTPDRLDTDFYAIRPLSILVTAKGAKLSAQTTFDLNVGGVSLGELVVKIVAPIVSGLSTLWALYRNRAWFVNRYKYSNYQPLIEDVVIGEHYQRSLNTPAKEIRVVQATVLRSDSGSCSKCMQFLRGNRLPLPALPEWLFYKSATNSLVSKTGPDMAEDNRELFVEILDEDGVLREQYTLRIRNSSTDIKVDTSQSGRNDEVQLQPLNRN